LTKTILAVVLELTGTKTKTGTGQGSELDKNGTEKGKTGKRNKAQPDRVRVFFL
jgi:hypothetical protein